MKCHAQIYRCFNFGFELATEPKLKQLQKTPLFFKFSWKTLSSIKQKYFQSNSFSRMKCHAQISRCFNFGFGLATEPKLKQLQKTPLFLKFLWNTLSSIKQKYFQSNSFSCMKCYAQISRCVVMFYSLTSWGLLKMCKASS